jgi:hypothetical protein
LATDPILLKQMGERARHAFDAEFGKSIAVARWKNLLLDVSEGATPNNIHRNAGPLLASKNAR